MIATPQNDRIEIARVMQSPQCFPTGTGQSDTRVTTLKDGRPNPHPCAGTAYPTITEAEIVAMITNPQSVEKQKARWFLPSSYVACDARDHAVQRKIGLFWWLCIDIDENNLKLEVVASALEALAPGASRLLYSTRSSTVDSRRWRALLPLEVPLAGVDYTDTAKAFFALLGEVSAGTVRPDPKLALTGQIIYLPNRGELYEQEVVYGRRLHLSPDHMVIRHRDRDRVIAEVSLRELAERRAHRATGRSASGTSATPIERFNATHRIADLFDRYGYLRLAQTDDWRSPLQSSSTYATRNLGDHWMSLSGSDAASGLGSPSQSGARFGDAFDLLLHFEHGGDFRGAVAAIREECRSGDLSPGLGTEVREREHRTSGNATSNDDTMDGDRVFKGAASDDQSKIGTAGDSGASGSPDPNTAPRKPTTFVWRDPALIPGRPWLYGRHLLRGQVSVTVAPSGIGKSSMSIVEALAMVTGRRLLDDWVAPDLRVWLLNLEDPVDELERRVAAAMQHHRISAEDLGNRLFVDSGRDWPLCAATQQYLGAQVNSAELNKMVVEINVRRIDVLILDPFVSSHTVNENDNGAVDLVVKQFWAALAQRCNCTVELVHHTRKLGSEEGTSESGRGASALLGAARSGRVLNRMTREDREKAGIPASDATSYFSVIRDKANLAPPGMREWRRVVPVELANGDSVGVVEAWSWPDDFAGIGARDLQAAQQAIGSSLEPLRYSEQASPWVGTVVAGVLGIDSSIDHERKRVKRLIDFWLKSGALVKVEIKDESRRPRPCVQVGVLASA